MTNKIAIIGTVGLPAIYGGFETLAEYLTKYLGERHQFTVFCSSKSYDNKTTKYNHANLVYVPLNANGVQSVPYDIVSLFSAVWNRNDVILLLGISGAVVLPLVRLFSSARIITNIDGIEWRREKWQGCAKQFLRFSEKMAVRFSHEVIADNYAIAEYVKQAYGVDTRVIAYGGDHAVTVDAAAVDEHDLPESYAFSVCRIEPENNVHMVLEAFARLKLHSLVMVGNWKNSDYGRLIREQYANHTNLILLDPIYDLSKLKTLRSQATFYVHGHSAGGTNPSLVEAMHFGKPILAFDCNFNHHTTEDKALFFGDSEELRQLIASLDKTAAEKVGRDMLKIAQSRYTWNIVAQEYSALLGA